VLPFGSASVTKGVFEFQKRFENDGIIGVIARISDCWKQAGGNMSQDIVAFCFTIDYVASDLSEFVSKKENSAQPEFLRIERVLSRANVVLKKMKVEQSDRGKLISGWIKLSRMTVSFLRILARNRSTLLRSIAENKRRAGNNAADFLIWTEEGRTDRRQAPCV
jgi:hypothetical protein